MYLKEDVPVFAARGEHAYPVLHDHGFGTPLAISASHKGFWRQQTQDVVTAPFLVDVIMPDNSTQFRY